jgi:hypothetical protein
MYTYTAYKLNNGVLSNKEYLNNIDEVNTWIHTCNYPTIKIVQDATNKYRILTCINSFTNEYNTVEQSEDNSSYSSFYCN